MFIENNTSGRLLDTAAADVMRLLSDCRYEEAAERLSDSTHLRGLSHPFAAAYVVAVVVEGMKPERARMFVEALRKCVDEHVPIESV